MKVLVVIPALNEENYIEKCVVSVLQNEYPNSQLKVVVVDGGSSDKTLEILNSLKSNYPNLKVLENPEKFTPISLNKGLKSEDADAKIILGAHSEVDSFFIQRNIDILSSKPDVGCAGGVLENVYENKVAEIVGLAMSSKFGVGNASFRTGAKDGYVDTVAFGAYRSEVFEKAGYFDEDLVRNQDDEFNYRVLSNGFKIYLSNAIKAKYFVRGSYKKLWKQYFQYGYWKVYVNKKSKAITSIRQLFPALLVSGIILGGILALLLPKPFLFIWSGTLSLYILLSFVFAFQKSNSLNLLFKICFTFWILHFSYGIGYMKGFFNFIILNKKPSSRSKEISR